ncbi:hypothetical protein [Plasmodium yoelii yoelii]|uniref:Uncharacterized protein n=1 Tax=Plasmodium yoelii yoelii TaxID=73239 RepID=Q7RIP1_PLAYO|nr:hypothetical protein [Plasmodium yoelii yoelii]
MANNNENMNFKDIINSRENQINTNIINENMNNYCNSYNLNQNSVNICKGNTELYNQGLNSNANMNTTSRKDNVEIYVENMLSELKNKMQNLSNNLLSKVDNMEKSIYYIVYIYNCIVYIPHSLRKYIPFVTLFTF